MAQRNASPMLHGTLELLVLRSLAEDARHGYGIAKWLEDRTDEVVEIEEGSLYPALYRMEKRGWIEAEWRISELNRKAKFYRLTQEGRRQLAAETQRWLAFSLAVTKVLAPA
jgi:PadR family transcriptional regulator PadR